MSTHESIMSGDTRKMGECEVCAKVIEINDSYITEHRDISGKLGGPAFEIRHFHLKCHRRWR